MKSLVFTVTNDLSFDQRMNRICSTLADNGFQVTLIGRRKWGSLKLIPQNFKQVRIPCLFQSGKLFYLEYNFKLFIRLLLTRFDTVCAIDLDSILPAYLASFLKGKKLVYDAHEYFTEMEEIVHRPMIKKAWLGLERFIMKRIDHAYTISEGYASLFRKHYDKEFAVIRNVPVLQPVTNVTPQIERYIQYQGVLNVGRGLEEAIDAMRDLDECQLRIFGDGPFAGVLKDRVRAASLRSKVSFMGMVRPTELREQTANAWVGLTLFSETGLHHRHSLANRFFDYLHAGIPQIAMDYPEYRAFNDKYGVAILITELTPAAIVAAVKSLYYDPLHYQRMKENCLWASRENCWERESAKLISFYKS